MFKRESSLMELTAFRYVLFKIQICLFTLFYTPEYFRGLPTALPFMPHLYTSALNLCNALVLLLFHSQ